MPVPEGFVPDGFEPDASAAPASATAVPRPNAARPNFNRTILPDLARAGARAGVNALPGIGAMGGMAVGGLLGGAAAPFTAGTSLAAGPILGSLAGGKAGEWARYGLAPSVGLPQEMPGLLGLGDAANASLAGLGTGLKMGAEAVAPGMMRTGLKMMPTKREQWLASVEGGELPEQAALRIGRPSLSHRSMSVAARSAGKVQESAIQAAKAAGGEITAEDLAQVALRQAASTAKRALTKVEHDRIVTKFAKLADELLNQAAVGVKVRNLRPRIKAQSVPFDLEHVLTIKQAAAKIASPKFNQAAQGVNINATPDDIKMIADGARQALKKFPGVAEATLEAQKTKLLKGALSRGESRQQTSLPQLGAGALGASMAGAAGYGHGGSLEGIVAAPMGALVGHVLSSPEGQRALALALNSPYVQQALLYGPMGASIPARMMMTPPPMAPPDTLPPNPAWGQEPLNRA